MGTSRKGPAAPGARIPAALFCVFWATLLVSCPEPVPLYGTWADNKGNSLTFTDDGAFSAVIANSAAGTTENLSGSFSVLLNSLSIRIPDQDNRQIVTEWDIRGNMLYLDWTNENGTVPLTLYKVS